MPRWRPRSRSFDGRPEAGQRACALARASIRRNRFDQRGGAPPRACGRVGPCLDRRRRADGRARAPRPRLDLTEGQPSRHRAPDRSVSPGARAATRIRCWRGAGARGERRRRCRRRPQMAERSFAERRQMRRRPGRRDWPSRPARRLRDRSRRQLRPRAGRPWLRDLVSGAAQAAGRSARASCSSVSSRGSTRRSSPGAKDERSIAFARPGSIAPSASANGSRSTTALADGRAYSKGLTQAVACSCVPSAGSRASRRPTSASRLDRTPSPHRLCKRGSAELR